MSNLNHHSGDANYGWKMRHVSELAFGERESQLEPSAVLDAASEPGK